MTTNKAPLRVGVAMYERLELSDIVCIDILGSQSTTFVKELVSNVGLPPKLLPLSIPIKFYYISSSLSPTLVTPSMYVVPTTTYEEAPRDLDLLLIGGCPFNNVPAASDKFFKEAAEKSKCIMTTCGGSMWLASSGVLDGKKATTNRNALRGAREKAKEVQWVDQRWVVDGKFWSSGGAGCGIDMMAQWCKENFSEALVDVMVHGLALHELGKGQFYD